MAGGKQSFIVYLTVLQVGTALHDVGRQSRTSRKDIQKKAGKMVVPPPGPCEGKSWVDAFCGAKAKNVLSPESSFPAQIQAFSCLFLSLPVSEEASLGSSIWPPTLNPSALAFERCDNRGLPCV